MNNLHRPKRVELDDSIFSENSCAQIDRELWVCRLCTTVLKEDVGIICCTGCKTLFCALCMSEGILRCKSCGRKRVQFIKTILATGGDSDDEEELVELEKEVKSLQDELDRTVVSIESEATSFRAKKIILESKLTAFVKGGEIAAAKVSNIKGKIAQTDQKIKISHYVNAMDSGAEVPFVENVNEGGILMDISLCAEKYFKQQGTNLEKDVGCKKDEIKRNSRRQMECRGVLIQLKEKIFQNEDMEKLDALLNLLPKRPRNAVDEELDIDDGIDEMNHLNKSLQSTETKKQRLSEDHLVVNFGHLIEHTK